ncbi:MAG: DMT family transporter [Chloroflexota bacterium]|nr:MAG: DMT family transporter [Chloroflexota bacterium]
MLRLALHKSKIGQIRLNVAYVQFFLSCALAGGNYVAAKYLGQELAPLTGAALRFMLASACLMPWMLLQERRPSRATLPHLPTLFVLGLTGIFGFNALLFLGLQQTTASNASLISATLPMMVALLAIPLLRERVGRPQVMGILLSFVGVVYLVGRGSLTNIVELRLNPGDLLIIGATMCSALYTIIGRRIVSLMSPLSVVAWATSAGAMLMVLFALLDPAWHSVDRLTPSGLIALLYMATLGSVVVQILWYRGLAHIEATKASIFTNVTPLSTLLWASALLGERLSIYVFITVPIVLSGVFLVSRGKAHQTDARSTILFPE